MTYQSYTIIAKRASGRLFGDTVTSDSPVADFNEIYRHGGAFEIVAVIPGAEPYGELAKKHMGVETLEYQADVDLDIHALSYHQIKNALRDAYYRGFVAWKERMKPPSPQDYVVYLEELAPAVYDVLKQHKILDEFCLHQLVYIAESLVCMKLVPLETDECKMLAKEFAALHQRMDPTGEPILSELL